MISTFLRRTESALVNSLNRIVSGFLAFFFLTSFSLYAQNLPDHSTFDRLLKKYVHEGLMDYEALLGNRTELDEYLKQLENYPLDSFAELSREERIAFWINLYNASVLRMILDEYPIQQIHDIPAVFEIRTIKAIDEYFNLSELFNEVLRKGFRDERILTALVSGQMDSPRLFNEAFTGDRIDEQLNQVAFQFVENNTLNKIQAGSKKIYLSPLFRTFGTDFLMNYGTSRESRYSEAESAVISFLLHHLKDPQKRIFLDSSRYQIEYLSEDPRLNAVKETAGVLPADTLQGALE